jgi:hypothetical protein
LRESSNGGTHDINPLSIPGSVVHEIGDDEDYEPLMFMKSGSLENHIVDGIDELDIDQMKQTLEDSIYSPTDL